MIYLHKGSSVEGHPQAIRETCVRCSALIGHVLGELPRPPRYCYACLLDNQREIRGRDVMAELNFLCQELLRGKRKAAGRRLLRLASYVDLPAASRKKFELFCEIGNYAEVGRRLGFGTSTIYTAVRVSLERIRTQLRRQRGPGVHSRAVADWLREDLHPLLLVCEDGLDERGEFDHLREMKECFERDLARLKGTEPAQEALGTR